MTSEEKDEFICRELGIPWHRVTTRHDECAGFKDLVKFDCSCGVKKYRTWEIKDHLNPDFTSEAGRVQLLKLAKEHENFYKLIERMANPDNFILFLTDDTGKFRDAVYGWMGGEE